MRVLALALLLVLMAGCGVPCPDTVEARWQDADLFALMDAPAEAPRSPIAGHPDVALRGISFVHDGATIHYEGMQVTARAGPGVEAAYRAFLENATRLSGTPLDDEVAAFMAATRNYAIGVAPGEAPGEQYQQHEHRVAIDAALLIDRLGITPDARAVVSGAGGVQFLGASKTVWLERMQVTVDVFGNVEALMEHGADGDVDATLHERIAGEGWPAPVDVEYIDRIC